MSFLPKHSIKVKDFSLSRFRHHINDLDLQPGPQDILVPGEVAQQIGSVDAGASCWALPLTICGSWTETLSSSCLSFFGHKMGVTTRSAPPSQGRVRIKQVTVCKACTRGHAQSKHLRDVTCFCIPVERRPLLSLEESHVLVASVHSAHSPGDRVKGPSWVLKTDFPSINVSKGPEMIYNCYGFSEEEVYWFCD